MTRRPGFLAAALVLASLAGSSSAVRAGERPVVLELFTSQGCSSCPPAEAVLGTYAGRADVLPLGFHVTYWDRLGWRDPFSLEAATSRQAAYEGQLGSGTSFTPQMVIDGRFSAIGSRKGEIAAAIEKARAASARGADVAIGRNGDRLAVRVGAGSGRARILLVGFDRRHTTAVGRGENGGRTITQSNVVRSIRPIGAWTGGRVELSEPTPTGEEIAVILQAPGGEIVGAARLGSGA